MNFPVICIYQMAHLAHLQSLHHRPLNTKIFIIPPPSFTGEFSVAVDSDNLGIILSPKDIIIFRAHRRLKLF